MYDQVAVATRRCQEQISLITRIYERGLSLAQQMYYEDLTSLTESGASQWTQTASQAQGPGTKEQPAPAPEPKLDEDPQVSEALDFIFNSYNANK
jgi:hypothetical protein